MGVSSPPCPYGDSLCRFGDRTFSAPAMLFKSIFEVFRADYRFLQRGFVLWLLPLSLSCKGVFVRKLHVGRPQQHGRRRKGPVARGSKTTHPESHVLMGIRCVVLETGPFRRRPCCLGQLLEPSSRSLRVFGRINAFCKGDLRGGRQAYHRSRLQTAVPLS